MVFNGGASVKEMECKGVGDQRRFNKIFICDQQYNNDWYSEHVTEKYLECECESGISMWIASHSCVIKINQ